MLDIWLIADISGDRNMVDGPVTAGRSITLDALPAVGHRISVDDAILIVDSIQHDADAERGEPTTEITCKVRQSQIARLVSECSWKRIE
jgi:hypothetical protein